MPCSAAALTCSTAAASTSSAALTSSVALTLLPQPVIAGCWQDGAYSGIRGKYRQDRAIVYSNGSQRRIAQTGVTTALPPLPVCPLPVGPPLLPPPMECSSTKWLSFLLHAYPAQTGVTTALRSLLRAPSFLHDSVFACLFLLVFACPFSFMLVLACLLHSFACFIRSAFFQRCWAQELQELSLGGRNWRFTKCRC